MQARRAWLNSLEVFSPACPAQLGLFLPSVSCRSVTLLAHCRPRSPSLDAPAVVPGATARLQAQNRSLQADLAGVREELATIRAQQADENNKSEKLSIDVKTFTAQLMDVKDKARADKKRSQQRCARLPA
jgi:hypothetical protein